MMLLLQINENSPKLLPLDNGEDCIQRVQLGYLYVTRILIIFIPYCIGHPLFHLLFDSRHACSRSDQTTYLVGVILCVESHAYIDEGNLRDQRLGDEVENIRASAAQSNDGDPIIFQFFIDRYNSRAARRVVQVAEYGLFISNLSARISLRGRVAINGMGIAFEDSDVPRHLLVVVWVAALGFMREREFGGKALTNCHRPSVGN